MPTVAVAVVSGTALFELATAIEVFGADRSYLTPDWYSFKLCAAEPGEIRTELGLVLDTKYGLDDLVSADLVIVPAAGVRPERHGPLLEALRTAHANGARVASICTGAFLLAEAGLLDGRRATTHWAYADDLAARYPRVTVDPNVLYVEDERVFTSAGSAAGIDLSLHLVRSDFGSEIANAVARRMVVPPHRGGGQAQYVAAPLAKVEADTLGPVLDWALAHLDEQVTLDDLADVAHVSVRTLMRRFQAATGTTPLQWLLMQRVRRAQHLLESSDEPVERIASLAGFGSAANLRQHFTRVVGVPPISYRRTFKCEHDGRCRHDVPA
ncbi:MAG TPA: helix-turn-helix domain-containing protein [Mycobacteriales bacterium]|jgi:transcriptional regulator GlxA family with amidase domain|nr:helix-turn-helix domain-containing protein [Mycobacteriales bacterium]